MSEPSRSAGGGSPSGRAQPIPQPVLLLLLAAAYFAAGKSGLSVALVHPSASPVWAPTGIALACILSFGYRVWPAIFVGAFLVNATTAGSIATSLGIATGNTLEGIVGAWLTRRFANGLEAFESAADTFRFAAVAGMLSTALSATFGVSSLVLGGLARAQDIGRIWLTWWLGDLGGCLVVAPLLILWSHGRRPRWTRAHAIEAVAMLVTLIAVARAVFGGLLPPGLRGFPLAFACMPPLIWAAFRFDQRVAAAAILALSSIAVWGTVDARGSFGREELNQSLLLLQVFLGVTAVTALALSATVAEQRRADAASRSSSEKLREAMTELEAFSRSISHDVRSPLGAVLNYAAIIEQDHGGRLEPEGLRLLHRVRVGAESAVHLLDQLAGYMWVGRETGESQEVDMTSLAREAYAELAVGAEQAGDVHFDLAELPAARGYPALLMRVFRNLFSNSVKYTRGRDDRRIGVAGVAGERENTYVVSDNGVGFDPAHGAALYQPFRRLGPAMDSEGAGLGLAIVAKIVRRHGGRVWAESDGKSGARFSFTLPHDGDGT